MADTLTCGDCGQTKPVQVSGGTGFGYYREGDSPDIPICYDCCGIRDREAMQKEGRYTLYLTPTPKGYKLTNWPGTLRFGVMRISTGLHNIAGRRLDVWFHGPDGYVWHGVQYGDNTQLCHCKRTARKGL